MRLDAEALVNAWLSDPETNLGVVVEVKDVSRQAVSSVSSQLKLVVRYGFVISD